METEHFNLIHRPDLICTCEHYLKEGEILHFGSHGYVKGGSFCRKKTGNVKVRVL